MPRRPARRARSVRVRPQLKPVPGPVWMTASIPTAWVIVPIATIAQDHDAGFGGGATVTHADRVGHTVEKPRPEAQHSPQTTTTTRIAMANGRGQNVPSSATLTTTPHIRTSAPPQPQGPPQFDTRRQAANARRAVGAAPPGSQSFRTVANIDGPTLARRLTVSRLSTLTLGGSLLPLRRLRSTAIFTVQRSRAGTNTLQRQPPDLALRTVLGR